MNGKKREIPELQNTKHEENDPPKIEKGDISTKSEHKSIPMVDRVDMANSRQYSVLFH